MGNNYLSSTHGPGSTLHFEGILDSYKLACSEPSQEILSQSAERVQPVAVQRHFIQCPRHLRVSIKL